MQRRRAGWLALGMLLLAFAAAPAGAVLIASGDGTGNTSPPPDDPGFAHAGVLSSNSAVYLGDGWVLTANHVSVGSVTLGGVYHAAVPGTTVQLEFTPGVLTDLKLFRLVTDPGLPSLSIAAAPPVADEPVVMIGHGRNRGAATSWNGHDGWLWASGRTTRWGTNNVALTGLNVVLTPLTIRAFSLEFDDDGGITDEAVGATGDSGGPVFVENGPGFELAGLIFAIYSYIGQPASTSLFGNGTYAADLSYYRDQILAITAGRACSDGSDDDGDGQVDLADPGCLDAADAFETNALVPCDDGFDNDADGLVDWPDDPGCKNSLSLLENPQCDDNVDNDGDGAHRLGRRPGGRSDRSRVRGYAVEEHGDAGAELRPRLRAGAGGTAPLAAPPATPRRLAARASRCARARAPDPRARGGSGRTRARAASRADRAAGRRARRGG